ncbi:MAG: biotin synthase BioB [Planctomycetota bacterium]|jgi:biotin synthase|nr:biotin synthase BioB [Candidatus Woesearchaeota archaeon]MDP6386177.1 biotin synthase BioB [Planctomycetota bacterium]MDP6738526.1 biotin synthase BioB [Planctomycetota bacterium]MDP6939540.1 biotin synthase BioB [Planctomycetota bacterium]
MPSTSTQTARPEAAGIQAAAELLAKPLLELVFEAATVHRQHHDPRRVQCSQLLSIKTGGCSEDCGYCSQSAHFDTGLEKEKLLEEKVVLEAARNAKAGGADRFCMGAAWREVREGEQFDSVLRMIGSVKELGLETCATLGMVDETQAQRLAEAGLDYYNHNLDTSRSHYDKVVTTRTYDDRLKTLNNVRSAGMSICCGGILGLGETEMGRAELLAELAAMDPQPESVPINRLVAIPGTPLEDEGQVDWADLVRVLAAARILMPKSMLRLSAGREQLSEEAQAMCFMAGANSIFVGEQLLTTPNPEPSGDAALLAKLGLAPLSD